MNIASEVAIAIMIVCAVPAIKAQQETVLREPAFEAASIHPAEASVGCYSMLPAGGTHYAVSCISLRDLIGLAWQIRPDYVQSSGAGSALSSLFSIKAVVPGDRPWTRATIPPMLRQLLRDRFHIVVHKSTKDIDGYALILAKSGSKLKAASSDLTQQGQKAGEPFQNYILPGYIHARGATLSMIASLLSSPAREVIVDETGLQGVFDVDLHYAQEGVGSDFTDIFTAVEEQLGLKLLRKRITVNTLMVEHIDDHPTAN